MKKNFLVVLFFLITCCTFVFSACSEKTNIQYQLNFIVDGDVYASAQVINNNIEKMPANPDKDGFVFDAWYFDDNVWKKPLTMQAIMELPISESTSINVYAHFTRYNCDIDNKQHDFEEVELHNPTCTQNGNKILKCKNCEYSYTQTLYATGHEYDAKTLKQATCTENGTIRYSCKKCDYYYDDIVDALNHNLGELHITTAPSCEVDGEGYRHCSRCEKDINEVVAKTNHRLDSTKHCTNNGCNYYELFSCSVNVTSQFGDYNQTVLIEYGKNIFITPKVFNLPHLKFIGYFNENDRISNEQGQFLVTYAGESSLSVTAKYYYSITTAQDFIDLQNDSLWFEYFNNQKTTESLQAEIENDIDFSNNDWKPVVLKGRVVLNGNHHILKNYYSTKGGLFKSIGAVYVNATTLKNIVFENANLNITNLSAPNNSDLSLYSIGILADSVTGYVDSVTIKNGSIIVKQSADTDLAVAGICGSANKITNCMSYVNIATTTAIASGIAISATEISNCSNNGKISTGDYLISPLLINTYISYFGTAGICNTCENMYNCTNFGEITAQLLNASGIVNYAAGNIKQCGNYASVSAVNGNSAGVANNVVDGNVSECFNKGNISGKTYAGGIISIYRVFEEIVGISNCYNIGDVESEEYAAGIACWFSNPFEPMKNCYNAGIITGKKDCVGGIVGKANGTSLFKCINTNNAFVAETCNQTSCLVGDDTDQAFIDLGFDTSIWKLTGDGKPVFTWENQV